MRRLFASAVLIMGIISRAHAESHELYVGISGARAEFHNAFAVFAAPGHDIDATDQNFKVFGGYKLTPHVAAELSYLGTMSFNHHYSDSLGSHATDIDLSNIAMNVVAIWPIGEHLELLGKVGFGLWKLEGTSTDTVASTVQQNFTYESGNGMSYGVGANYNVTNKLAIRGEYDVTEVFSDFELRTYSIGAIWRF